MTALRRAAASHLVVVIAILVVGAGIAGGALVGFSAEDQNASSTFAGGWIGAATSLQTPTVAGYGATLSWTPATHGLDDQALYGTDQGTTSNCTGATYATPFNASLGVATATTTDDRGSSANGHWVCYQLRSVRTGTNWTNTANFSVVRVGLVGSTIASTNGSGSTSGSIDNGDKITFTFNQPVTYGGSATVGVCVFRDGTLLVGDNCASSADTPSIAKVTGLTIGANKTYPSSGVAASGSALVVTVGGGGNGASGRTTVSGSASAITFTATAASALQSTTGGATVCTSPTCTWSYTHGF